MMPTQGSSLISIAGSRSLSLSLLRCGYKAYDGLNAREGLN